MKRVFLSFKRHVEPDHSLAREVYDKLREAGHMVFIDQIMLTGIKWAQEIERQIKQCDCLIVFLTAASSRSEMVQSEIEMARQFSKIILPVRVAFAGKLPYPLNAHLDPVHYAFWRASSDTARLIEQLAQAISGFPLPSPSLPHPVEPPSNFPPAPGGAIDLDDPHYIVRPHDKQAIGLARNRGQTIVLKGPRQVGKTSLLFRIIDSAQQAGKMVAFVDMQLLQSSGLSDSAVFYDWFAQAIASTLEVPLPSGLKTPMDVTSWMESSVLRKLSKPVALAVDESECMLWAGFREDFFGMLRSWHNLRANPVKRIWKNLDLYLVTSTEPALLIQGAQSPFNVGTVIPLARFDDAEMARLNQTYGEPMTAAELTRLRELVGGHPYLACKGLHEVAPPQPHVSPEQLFATAADDSGPFRDHLRRFLIVLQSREMADVLGAFRDVVRERGCSDKALLYRLESAGLVVQHQGNVIPSCPLYQEYFHNRL